MASIPTSFLPHPTSATMQKSASGIVDVLAYLAFVVAGAIFVLAIGVFLYGRVLASTKSAKDAALAEAVNKLDVTTVPTFSRLHDRLNTGVSLLGNHIALSGLFPLLETVMPSTIRFNSLHISFSEKNAPVIDGTGVAKNFNSLAVASSAFATEKSFRGALLSNISLLKDGYVSFAFSATLDPKVIVFTP